MGRGVCVSRLQDGTVHLVYGILEEPFGSLEAINTSALRTGLQRVQLLKPNISVPALPSDMHSMEIHTPDILIPSQRTTYWCHITELPDGFSRHHIVMVPGGEAGPRAHLCFLLGPQRPLERHPCPGKPFMVHEPLAPGVPSLPEPKAPCHLLSPQPPRAPVPPLPRLDQRTLMF